MLNVLNFSFLPDYRIMTICTNLQNKEIQSNLFSSSYESQYSSLQTSACMYTFFVYSGEEKTNKQT